LQNTATSWSPGASNHGILICCHDWGSEPPTDLAVRRPPNALKKDSPDLLALAEPPLAAVGRFQRLRQRLRARLPRVSPIFLGAVILPTLLAAVYYGLIASDIYISESRFIVRSSQRPAPSGFLGSFLQGTGISRAEDDTFAVHDFILSRDALGQLDQKLSLGNMFSRPDIDFLDRFGAIDWDRSFETLYRYYKKRVSVEYDSASSISVLRVSAFTAHDANRINDLLLGMGEQLVNQMSERARSDIVRYAEGEVQQAEHQAADAALALAAFRNRNVVVDPEKQSTFQLQQVSKLQDDLIATRTQVAQLKAVSPDSPQIMVLQTKIDTLQSAIEAETAKVTGRNGSLSNKAAAYERVELEREFADKQLGAALAALEAARSEAQHQLLYLERIVQPNRPDIAIEPRRLRSVVIVFLLGLLAWGILSLLVASIREHMQ
jgi:capsular polysaccharide transport system permease protein